MRAYDSQKEIDSQINAYIENYQFLTKKNLIKESEAELFKAKKISLLHERYEKLIEILKKEKALVRKKNPVAVSQMIEVHKEFEMIFGKMKCGSDYRYLNDLAFAYLHRDGKNMKVLEKNFKKILNDPLLKKENRAITFDAKLAYYQIYSAYYYATGRYPETLEMYDNIIKVMEDNPVLLKEYVKGYLIVLHNSADVCDYIEQEKGAKKYYNKINTFVNNSANNISSEIRQFIILSFGLSKIINLIEAGKYEAENPEIKQLGKDFLENVEHVILTNRITLMFQFTIYYFGCGDFNTSLKWLHMIINKDEELRSDIRIESKLIFLIIQLELKNYDLIDYAIMSTQRYLMKKEPLMGIEPTILGFIKKISNVKDSDKMKQLYIELKDSLERDKEIVNEYAFDYLSWVESKLQNKPFAEIKRKKYLKEKKM